MIATSLSSRAKKILIIVGLSLQTSAYAEPFSGPCLLLRIKGLISTGSAKYLDRGLAQAQEKKACLFVILDTPGGHLEATRQMVQTLLGADIPTVVWVGPSGAHAGSAGVFITLAAEVAAMASGTNIGAAHPVQGTGKDMEGEIAKKVLNDTKAFALSIAEKRNRNKAWIVAAVEDSQSITSDEALKLKTIDVIAESPAEVVQKVWPGSSVSFIELETSTTEKIVTFLANPNIAYMLLGFGALGIYVEITHPGLIFPGVTGVLCLLLSFISMNFIPINYGALGLIFLGIGLLIAEMFITSFGVLGIGGVLSFVLGSLFFVDEVASGGQSVHLGLILPLVAGISAVAFVIGRSLLKLRRSPPLHGASAYVGKSARIESWDGAKGKALLEGELWDVRSQSSTKYSSGQAAVVRALDGLVLIVD